MSATGAEQSCAELPDDSPLLVQAACTDATVGHDCKNWAATGECTKNKRYMRQHCRKSCNLCGENHECVRGRDMPSAFANGQLERLFQRVGAAYRAVSVDPWVVVIDDLITPDDASAMLQQVEKHTFQQSKDARYDESHRTSRTVHCGVIPQCAAHPSVRRLERRASELLGIPLTHAESVQVVRYQVGEEYKTQ